MASSCVITLSLNLTTYSLLAQMGAGPLVGNRLGQCRRLGMSSIHSISFYQTIISNSHHQQVALVATNALLSSQLILGIISATHAVRYPSFVDMDKYSYTLRRTTSPNAGTSSSSTSPSPSRPLSSTPFSTPFCRFYTAAPLCGPSVALFSSRLRFLPVHRRITTRRILCFASLSTRLDVRSVLQLTLEPCC